MKLFLRSIFVLLLFMQVGAVASQTKLPAELHGYWEFYGNGDDWHGMHVGENYVELSYDLFSVKSIKHVENKYSLVLAREKAQILTLEIQLLANDSAVFSFEGRDDLPCKRLKKNPEINYLDKSEYSKIITGEWFAITNVKNKLSIKQGKLNYDGSLWNVIWLGEYKGREHRALIETNGKYRLIYLSSVGDNRLKLIYFNNATYFSAISELSPNATVFGNWYEPKSNEWTFGFFDKLAIYDSKVWKYTDLSIKKNKGVATLQNGDNKIQLKFRKIKDSTIQIAQGKGKYISYKLAKQTLPNYPMPDTTSFADNQFARMDTAYISGYMPNRNSKDPVQATYQDMIESRQVAFYADIDDEGYFELKVPIYNTTNIFFDWQKSLISCVLEPNEHYFLYYDHTSKQMLYMGKESRINNELAKFDLWDLNSERPKEQMNAIDFLHFQQNTFKKSSEYVTSFLGLMQYPSFKLDYYLGILVKYQMAFDLMQYRFKLDRQNKEKFPDEYLDFVKKTILSDIPKPITLNRDFFSFVRDFVGYMNQQEGKTSFNSVEIMASMVTNKKLKLNKADKDLVDFFNDYYSRVRNTTDSVELRKMQNERPKSDAIRFNEIYKQHSEQIDSEMFKLASKSHLESELKSLNKFVVDKLIRDYYVAYLLYKEIKDTQKPIDQDLFDEMANEIGTKVFKEKVMATQKFYTDIASQSLNHAESLKNTDHLKESKDADSLWHELIEPYKGKVIYVDFWGTWCGPCKSEMEYVADIKKQFVGKDVIFMYFANNSPEESWKNVIKTYSLTGENVVQYRLPNEQQSMIERRFGINSYPTYLLIDRNGSIVDTNPPRPSGKEATVGFLNKWLEK